MQPPSDVDTALAQKIQQEHAATRQFISTEIKKQVDSGITEFTKRADYYETAYEKITNHQTMMLGLFWGGIYLFLSSAMYFLHTKTEKRRYGALKDNLTSDVSKEVLTMFKGQFTQLPQEVMSPYAPASVQPMKTALQKLFKHAAETPTQQPPPQNAPVAGAFNQPRANPGMMPLPPNPNISYRKMQKMEKKLRQLDEEIHQSELRKMQIQSAMGVLR